MTPESEEIVLHPDRRQPQHLGERPTHQLLAHGGRFTAGTGGVQRCGQGLAVEFAVDRQRQVLQFHEGRGDQVLREPFGRVRAHRVGERRLGPGRHQIGDQPLVARGVLPYDDGRLADRRMGGHHRLDLARLHPETADLHLVVGPAHEDEPALGVPAHQVAGAVHPLTGGLERAGHETLTGQHRATRVTPRDAGTGYVQLTGDTDRHWVQRTVQDIHARVVERTPDRQHTVDLGGVRDLVLRRTQGHLGRAVQLPHRHARVGLQHPPHRVGRDHVTTGQHLTHARETARVLIRQHPQQARRHMHMRHPVIRDQTPQHRPVHRLVRGDNHRAARQQRHPQLVRRRVERMRGMEQHPRGRTPAPVLRKPHHVPVRRHDTLRHTRRPRRIHHIRRSTRSHRSGQHHGGVRPRPDRNQ
ncbi:hypothetical protein FBY37_1335 [Streptomyces sp. SLBN-134]|nr:hypothetical protein FBY37_1335 [Streptomyces sp. SLBN-134]